MRYRTLTVLFLFLNFSYGISQQDHQQIHRKSEIDQSAAHYLKQLQAAFQNGSYSLHKKYSDSLYILGLQEGIYKYQILGMVNQGVHYNNAGEQSAAIQRYRNALTLTDSIAEDHRTKIIVLVNLGNTYTNIKAHRKAIETMKTVVELLDSREDNPRIRASAYNGIANNYESLDNDSTALTYHKKTQKLGESINDESVIAAALNNICKYYLKKKEYTAAKETLDLALKLELVQKKTKNRASLLLSMGQVFSGLGDTGSAITYYKESLEIASQKGLSALETDAYSYLQRAYDQLGDTLNANLAKAKYLELTNTYLERRESATKLDLEQDLIEKNIIIASKEESVENLEANRTKLLFWGGTLAAVLLITGISFALYSKRTRKENNLLQEQFVTLQNRDNTRQERSLKTKLASYKNSSLTTDDLEKLSQQMVEYMEQEKPYLDPDLSHADLAKKLHISGHQLSEVLNNGFNQNFYNFINSYRVLEAQKLMKQDRFNTSKILAIAFDAGFKSKTSFNRVFKNHTGKTPSEYRNNLT